MCKTYEFHEKENSGAWPWTAILCALSYVNHEIYWKESYQARYERSYSKMKAKVNSPSINSLIFLLSLLFKQSLLLFDFYLFYFYSSFLMRNNLKQVFLVEKEILWVIRLLICMCMCMPHLSISYVTQYFDIHNLI